MTDRQHAWATSWIGKEVNFQGKAAKVVGTEAGGRGNGIWLILEGGGSKYVRFPKDLANPRR